MKTHRTIDPARVHKILATEVFVTDVEVGGETSPYATVFVPSSHHRMSGQSRVPLVVIVEALRQAGMAYNTHAPDAVSHVYILDRIAVTLTVDPDVGFRQRVDLEPEYLSASHARTCLVVENVCTSVFDYRRTDPRVYARLRGEHKACEMNSRHDPLIIHSMNAEGEPVFLLGWDTDDTMIFDHPVDHVPAIALIDAALAVHELANDSPPLSVDAQFLGYLNMIDPITITVDAGSTLFNQGSHLGARIMVR